MGDKWWRPVWCDGCGVEMVYDEGDGMLHCPKCDYVAYAFEADIEDLVERDIHKPVREALQRYKPGEFLFKGITAEEIADLFRKKTDKYAWTSMVAHDYLLAKLRKKGYVLSKMKEAMRLAALKTDHDLNQCLSLFPMLESDLKKWSALIPQTLFKLIRESLKVDGWRTREDETIHEGNAIRFLNLSPSDAGDLYRTEDQRWWELEYKTHQMYFVARKRGDRVSCWVIKNLLRHGVNYEHFGNTESTGYIPIDVDPYPDNLIEDFLNGRDEDVDIQATTVQLHLNAVEYYKGELGKCLAKGDYDVVANPCSDMAEEAVFAVATQLGWETLNPSVRARNYAKELSEKLGDPEINRLYEVATDFDLEDYEEQVEATKTLVDRLKGVLSALQPASHDAEKKFSRYIS
jgi:hypothetical protein